MFDFSFSVPVRLGNRTYRSWGAEIGRKNRKLNRPANASLTHTPKLGGEKNKP